MEHKKEMIPGTFQSTPPAREATPFVLFAADRQMFQSTPPAREATTLTPDMLDVLRFQSTPPAREATAHSRSMQ